MVTRYSQIQQHVDMMVCSYASKHFHDLYINCPSCIKSVVVAQVIQLFSDNVNLEKSLKKHDMPAVKQIFQEAMQRNEAGVPDILCWEMKQEFEKIFEDEKQDEKLEELRKICLKIYILVNK